MHGLRHWVRLPKNRNRTLRAKTGVLSLHQILQSFKKENTKRESRKGRHEEGSREEGEKERGTDEGRPKPTVREVKGNFSVTDRSTESVCSSIPSITLQVLGGHIYQLVQTQCYPETLPEKFSVKH